MREFTDITIIPATSFIAVDGEGYHCAALDIADVKGAMRTIPADRIMAIHWFGAHNHGQVEGFGAGEGFADRSIVEPYLTPWLAARAAAKREAVVVLTRTRDQQRDHATQWAAAVAGLTGEIAEAEVALKAASRDRQPAAQAHLDWLRRNCGLAAAQHERIVALAAERQSAIGAATAAADQATQDARAA